jgi:hypothetical protein
MTVPPFAHYAKATKKRKGIRNMRPAGNLAGVEFIHPPMYHNQTELWKEIISESGYFFTKSAMQWFGSRVAWDTLTAITHELYGFITSEQDSGGAWEGQRRYTVRGWTKESGVFELSEWGDFETLKGARHYLTRDGFADHPLVIEARKVAALAY